MLLEKDPGIKVVAAAKDGLDGIEAIRKHDPDVVTLDIEMPRMNGLEALAVIMKEMPRPVLMVSSLTSEGAEATLKALELGAADFIAKRPVIDNAYQEGILDRVRAVARGGAIMRMRRLTRQPLWMNAWAQHKPATPDPIISIVPTISCHPVPFARSRFPVERRH